MLFNALAASSLLIASALAAAEPRAQPMPYKLEKSKLVKMSAHEIFGLAGRQDNGYAPTQSYCNGPGDTCESACGPGNVQCPSTDDSTHCFIPGNGQKCCPDGLGNACDQGYFCTTNSDGTWCCPDGMSLTACAALYSVSSLTSLAPVTIATSASTGGDTASTTEIPLPTSTYTPPVDTVVVPPTTSYPSASFPTYTSSPNGTVTTSSPPVQVTGAANQLAHGALPALALAAGAVLAL